MMSAILESAVPRSSRLILRYAALGAFLAALVATLALGACGRKGPLDPPPVNSMQEPAAQGQSGSGETPGQPGAQAIEYGVDGRPLAPQGRKKKLPADWLID
jgi:predicted small lipoprotein YifL